MLVALVSLPPEALALEEAAEAVPEIAIETERIAAHSTKWVMPCLWVSNVEFDTIEEAFDDDPTVDEIVTIDRFDEEAFVQVEWTAAVERRIDDFLDREASILDARLHDGTWRVRIRFATRQQFQEFRDYFAEREPSFQLLRLAEPNEPYEEATELTPTQREALVTAAEHGYYQVPREITATELATELDSTHQAVSELLRRGTENLIVSTLTTGDEPDRR